MAGPSDLNALLTQLTHDISSAEDDVARIESERSAVARDVRRSTRRLRYLRLARAVRKPGAAYSLWTTLVILVGPAAIGVLVLIVVHLLTNSYPAAFFGFLLGTVAGVGLFSSIVYHPPNTLLPAAIAEAESQSQLSNARLREKIERLTNSKSHLQRLVEEQQTLIASGKLQKAALLQRNWKAMRDEEWEDFLAEVCRTLGARVERTGGAGDQGVDLIVQFGDRRIAVQAKGYLHAVNNQAIQQAYTGMAIHDCTHCAAITNSRFTAGARMAAQSTGCKLIDEVEFPDFVMGKIEL